LSLTQVLEKDKVTHWNKCKLSIQLMHKFAYVALQY